MFLVFASLNIGAMAPFALCVAVPYFLIGLLLIELRSLIPETKGRSLEEMDIIFGAIDADARAANIARQEQGM